MLEEKIQNLMGELIQSAEEGKVSALRTEHKFTPKSKRFTVTAHTRRAMSPVNNLITSMLDIMREQNVEDFEMVETVLYRRPSLGGRLEYEWYIGFNPLENQLVLW